MKRNHVYGLVLIAVAAFALFYFTVYVQSKEDFAPSLQLVIEYEDGSSQRFSPEKVPLLSNSIVDSTNKVIKNLRAELYVTVDYTGSASSWDASGRLDWHILDSAKTQVAAVTNRPLEPQNDGGPPPKNTPFVISSATISASGIEAMTGEWESGETYYLRFAAFLTFRINFSDGSSESKDSYAVFLWQFRYEGANQFTSLQVTWQPVTYY